MPRRNKLFALSLFAAVFGVFLLLWTPDTSAGTINNQINFQGKLTNPDGTNVADGTYSIVFSIYPVASGGTAVWTETQSSVSVSAGNFQVNLGSVTALPGSVNFGSSSLYLGIKIGADPEMTPRIQFTAAPYAFNADQLGGLSPTAYVQLAQGIQADSSATSSIAINKTGASGNIVQLQKSGNDVFVIANTGAITANTTSYQSNFVTINNGNTGATPAIPGSYLPTLTIRSKEASGARPLFFGYDNGGGAWDAFFNAGACGGVYTRMCLDLGSGTTSYTALENNGTTLQVGGGDGGNFTNITFNNSGTATFGSAAVANGTLTANNGMTLNSGTALALAVTSGTSVPTADQVTIDNTGSTGVTTAGVNGLNVHYKGGAAAVEAAGMRVDYTPGTVSGGTWSGMRIVENTASAAGVTAYGLKLEGGGSGGGTSTALYADSNWDIGLDLQSGGIQLASQADPAAPSGNNLRIYAKAVAGRVMPKWKGPAGVDTPFQASFGFNRIAMMTPNNGTSATAIMTEWGGAFTNSGSVYSTPALDSTNLVNSVRRSRIQTATTAGSVASHRPKALMVWRGNTAGVGGFFFTTRFTFDATGPNNFGFIGLVDSTAAPSNTDPTTDNNPGKVGVGFNSNSTMYWINNARGTAPTSTTIPGATPDPATLYELIIYCPPNGSTIYYRVQNISTGTIIADSSVTTNIPDNTTFLAPQFWISNNGTSTAAYVENAGWYLESDN